jgi:hypothetical protein
VTGEDGQRAEAEAETLKISRLNLGKANGSLRFEVRVNHELSYEYNCKSHSACKLSSRGFPIVQ